MGSEDSLRHYCHSKIESRSFDLNVIRKRMLFGAHDDKVGGQDDRLEGRPNYAELSVSNNKKPPLREAFSGRPPSVRNPAA
jgi:hypothetical protein